MSILPTVHERLRAAILSNAGLIDRPASPLVESIRDDIDQIVERSRRFKVKARSESLQLNGPPRYFSRGRRGTIMESTSVDTESDEIASDGSAAEVAASEASAAAADHDEAKANSVLEPGAIVVPADGESPLDERGDPDVNIVQTHDPI